MKNLSVLSQNYLDSIKKIGKKSSSKLEILGFYVFKLKIEDETIYQGCYKGSDDLVILYSGKNKNCVIIKLLDTLLTLGYIEYEEYFKNYPRSKRQEVDSSNIKAVGYTDKLELLQIEFLNDRVYEYYEVPEGVYSDLINSDSIGSSFHKLIKNNFEYKEIK